MVDKLSIKDKLSQLNDIKKEISELDYKIKQLEKEGIKLAAVQESRKRPPFGKHDIVIEAQTPKTRNLMCLYKSMLQQRLEKLLKIEIEIESFINTLPTARLQRIFEYKCINDYSWQKIAFIIGGKATKESVKKEYQRFLQEN